MSNSPFARTARINSTCRRTANAFFGSAINRARLHSRRVHVYDFCFARSCLRHGQTSLNNVLTRDRKAVVITPGVSSSNGIATPKEGTQYRWNPCLRLSKKRDNRLRGDVRTREAAAYRLKNSKLQATYSQDNGLEVQIDGMRLRSSAVARCMARPGPLKFLVAAVPGAGLCSTYTSFVPRGHNIIQTARLPAQTGFVSSGTPSNTRDFAT